MTEKQNDGFQKDPLDSEKPDQKQQAMIEGGFFSHLIELRDRLIKVTVTVLVLFLAMFPWSSEIYDFLATPMLETLPQGTRMIATGVITPFFVPVKLTLMVAFLGALPVILYHLWRFIAPALYSHERRLIVPLIASSVTLFFVGMAFCYYFVFGTVFSFIASIAPKSVTPAPDIEAYMDFVTGMFFAFGTAFEAPVVIVLLIGTGVVSVAQVASFRPYAIVGAFIIAAIVTPPDVLSQILLAVPMCLLYELGLLVARVFRLEGRLFRKPLDKEAEPEIDL